MTGGSAGARRRVLLLFGGRSAEHDVSRVTAVAVARALDPEKYEIVP
ncbi:MAG: D-alanine-D-alanine ligase, partial [Actinomycetota bacterium]|nr:D-alanine-D-alanine ligase [Actinomycetota bacterium]